MRRHALMNRVCRLIWSRVRNAWVAVAETARGQGKGSSRKLISAAVSLSAVVAHAASSGGQVVAGTGSIAQWDATTMRQSRPNPPLGWQSFGIGADECVSFLQPNASAISELLEFNSCSPLARPPTPFYARRGPCALSASGLI